MADRIFFRQGNQLIPMVTEGYESEDRLQALLAAHPDLLSPDDGEARRWLLVAREVGIPDGTDAPKRWAVDHLFLDQEGVPTLVEVKRQTDTRLRREVVGQMLDYAANAVAWWPVDRIRSKVEAAFEERGLEAQQGLSDALEVQDEDVFWRTVKTNLQAGRVRLLFVADVIPPELQRVVEFLNAQMDPAEVLALELRQYVGGGVQTLIPRVYGQTSEAQQRKAAVRVGERGPNFRLIARLWNERGGLLPADENTRTRGYLQLPVTPRDVHYEWLWLKQKRCIGVALHFEARDRTTNFARLELVAPLAAAAAEKLGLPYEKGPFGPRWASGQILVPAEAASDDRVVHQAVESMLALVEATWSEVEKMKA